VNLAVIGFGSNIKPDKNIAAALQEIGRAHRVLAASSLERTRPVGPAGQASAPDQPDFLNGACLVETSVDRPRFREWLKQLEDRMGRRRRGDKFGPRTIDLDIVVWNGEFVDEDLHERDFLRRAVLEVCPGLEI
jgi:2-amino-4-hydroxy-6-hydroxymethyldihydropteridine diphosphokinase